MATIIIGVVGLWCLGSLVICVGLCRAAAEADRKAEQHRLAFLLGVKEPGKSRIDVPTRPRPVLTSARQPVR